MERLTEQQDIIIRLLGEILHHLRKDNEIMTDSDDLLLIIEPSDDEYYFVVHDEHVSDRDRETRARRLKLYRAALNGNWEVAKRIYEVHKDYVHAGLSKTGETALHIAAGAKRTDFVKELLKMKPKGDLAKKNAFGKTALSLAAMSGMVELARIMMEEDKAIAKVRDDDGMLPIVEAASLGHKDMVEYLYQETKYYLDEEDQIELLLTLINSDLYDIALQLVKDYPELATARAANKETALHALAQKHRPSYTEKTGYSSKCVNLGVKDAENKDPAIQLVEFIWKRAVLLSDSKISKLITMPKPLIFEAAKQGNDQFLCILIREYPDLIWKVDENCYSIFHIAVKNRQQDIFKLIYEIGSSKDLIVLLTDKEGNNILHLAGMMAPSDRLSILPGAALQLQREGLWFEEVKNVVQPRQVEAKNNQGFTPRALFEKQHEGLREKGEKWLKETATSCMVVATLIAAVAFAAAITVPGGNKEDTGLPFFLDNVSFKIFAISNAISLVSSSTSISFFLSIFTSRHAQVDFLRSSPRKLNIGLVMLLISIGAMMVVFSEAFFIVLNRGWLWIAIAIVIIACTPVIMFIWQHSKLIFEVFRTTYASGSLFHKGESSLFHEEGEASEGKKAQQFNAHLLCSTCSTNV